MDMNAINDKIAANSGLVYQQLTKFQMLHDQDAESFAYEALYRAVVTYDESTGNAFSTYAVCCISNALRKHLRTFNKKRTLDVVSYHTPVITECDGDDIYLIDVLTNAIDDAETTLICNEECAKIYRAFEAERELLSPLHRKIIDVFYNADGKLSQKEVGAIVGTTQVTVSRAISQFRNRLKIRLEEQE